MQNWHFCSKMKTKFQQWNKSMVDYDEMLKTEWKCCLLWGFRFFVIDWWCLNLKRCIQKQSNPIKVHLRYWQLIRFATNSDNSSEIHNWYRPLMNRGISHAFYIYEYWNGMSLSLRLSESSISHFFLRLILKCI